jgi:hypothetical protein
MRQLPVMVIVSACIGVAAAVAADEKHKSQPPASAVKGESSKTAVKSDGKVEWAVFSGKAVKKDGKVVLSDKAGGSIEMAAPDVEIGKDSTRVRIGVPAKILAHPKAANPVEKALQSKATGLTELAAECDCTSPKPCCAQCIRQDDCPSKCCACIGLVRVCCGDGGTRGICLGVWSCPG